MYFNLSYNKLLFVGGLALLLSLLAAPAVFLKHGEGSLATNVSNAYTREKADASYVFFSKLPSELKKTFATALLRGEHAEATPPSENQVAKSIPVLVYHGEGDSGDTLSMLDFANHMRTLHENGWRTITFSQFKAFMKGTATVPDKSFLLTFDDGRRDAFYSLDPVLKDFGYTAVMFVITGFSIPGGSDAPIQNFYLSKKELATMLETGRWEIQSHGDEDHRRYEVPTATSTSENLIMVPDENFLSNFFWVSDENRMETSQEYEARIRNDLSRSNRLLEESFPIKVEGFAYPLNDFGEDSVNNPHAIEIIDRVIRSLYSFGFYQTWDGNGDSANYQDPTEHFIKRIEPSSSWSGEDLLETMMHSRLKPLPYVATNFKDGWKSNWGSMRVENSNLVLSATEATTGAAAFLDGTGGWKNYKTTATAFIESGTISLLARYTTYDAPYAVCAFSEDRIYLERHTGEALVKVASRPYAPPPLPSERTVSMEVSGPGQVVCSSGGVSASAFVPGIPATGGVGLTMWTPQHGSSKGTVTALQAESLSPVQ